MSDKPLVLQVVPLPTGSGIRRKVVVMLDGISTIEFFLTSTNMVWFDRWILLPLLKFILVKWLIWSTKGGRVEFVYFPEEGLKGGDGEAGIVRRGMVWNV